MTDTQTPPNPRLLDLQNACDRAAILVGRLNTPTALTGLLTADATAVRHWMEDVTEALNTMLGMATEAMEHAVENEGSIDDTNAELKALEGDFQTLRSDHDEHQHQEYELPDDLVTKDDLAEALEQ